MLIYDRILRLKKHFCNTLSDSLNGHSIRNWCEHELIDMNTMSISRTSSQLLTPPILSVLIPPLSRVTSSLISTKPPNWQYFQGNFILLSDVFV